MKRILALVVLISMAAVATAEAQSRKRAPPPKRQPPPVYDPFSPPSFSDPGYSTYYGRRGGNPYSMGRSPGDG